MVAQKRSKMKRMIRNEKRRLNCLKTFVTDCCQYCFKTETFPVSKFGYYFKITCCCRHVVHSSCYKMYIKTHLECRFCNEKTNYMELDTLERKVNRAKIYHGKLLIHQIKYRTMDLRKHFIYYSVAL